MRRGKVPLGGFELAYREWPGEAGAPVLLALHGSLSTGGMWRALGEALAPEVRVVAPDLRGYGESGLPPDARLRAGDFAADVAHLADALGLGGFHLAGHSFACAIAAHLAAAQPGRVPTLTLVEPTFFAAAEKEARLAAERARPLRFASREEAEAFWRRGEGALWPPGAERAWVEDTLRPLPGGGYETACARETLLRLRATQMEEEGGFDFLPLAGCLPMSTLIFRGERSTRFRPEALRRLMAALPHGREVVVPATNHFPTVTRPELLARELRAHMGAPA